MYIFATLDMTCLFKQHIDCLFGHASINTHYTKAIHSHMTSPSIINTHDFKLRQASTQQ